MKMNDSINAGGFFGRLSILEIEKQIGHNVDTELNGYLAKFKILAKLYLTHAKAF